MQHHFFVFLVRDNKNCCHLLVSLIFMDINQTLYVNGLNDRIGIENLKSLLFELFCTYGEILDIVAFDSLKKKGQAFIIFADIAGAVLAFNRLQGQMFCSNPLKIAYAKSKSNVIALKDGTYKRRNQAMRTDSDMALV